jgi:hypothetical protein
VSDRVFGHTQRKDELHLGTARDLNRVLDFVHRSVERYQMTIGNL